MKDDLAKYREAILSLERIAADPDTSVRLAMELHRIVELARQDLANFEQRRLELKDNLIKPKA
jgi:hypothetical protein